MRSGAYIVAGILTKTDGKTLLLLKPRGFCAGVVRAIDVVRKRTEVSIEEEPAAMEVAADTPDPLARREMTEDLKRLLECVGRLEPDRQKLVLLAYYNGWSREQLAAKFETPVNTVKTWLRRSMLDIRECLGL